MKKLKVKPLYRMDEMEREKAMTILLKKEKIAEIQDEVRKKNPDWTEAKVKRIAIRKYIYRHEGGLF